MKYAAVIAGLLAVAAIFYFPRTGHKHVFINQTSDHRFDDSIRTTILANFSRAGVQNAVVIAGAVPTGMNVESWAAQLFKDLNLGEKTGGKAILYLYVPAQKVLKIEVGYALEGVLPDVTVHALEEAAKSFTYAGRMHDFWADLINTVNVAVYNQQHSVPGEFYFKEWRYLSGGAGVARADYEFTAAQLRREFKNLAPGDRRFEPGSTARETADLFFLSLREGIGDANLPLLSAGSRAYRLHSPLNQALLKRMWDMYQSAGPYELLEDGRFAVVKFKNNHPVLPVFLFKTRADSWLVHEPYSFALFNRFEDSMSIFQTHPLAGSEIFSKIGLAGNVIFWGSPPFTVQPLETDGFFAKLAQLESASESAHGQFELADFYLFEMWNYEKADALYAEALSRQPARPAHLWRRLAPLIASGNIQEFLRTYKSLSVLQPGDARLKTNYAFYVKTFAFPAAEWLTEL